jgi:hypothetical protein
LSPGYQKKGSTCVLKITAAGEVHKAVLLLSTIIVCIMRSGSWISWFFLEGEKKGKKGKKKGKGRK